MARGTVYLKNKLGQKFSIDPDGVIVKVSGPSLYYRELQAFPVDDLKYEKRAFSRLREEEENYE
jgi:hypothetical protein